VYYLFYGSVPASSGTAESEGAKVVKEGGKFNLRSGRLE